MKQQTIVRIAAIAVVFAAARTIWAASIRLKDGTTLQGDVLQVEDDEVAVSLSREAVDTVNGEPLPPALKEGVAAPVFSASDLSGQPRAVGAGKAQATLLHFWVQWCPHCRSDSPQLQALYEKYRANPQVQIVTVNLDKKRDKVDAFLKEKGITYPVVMATEARKAGVDLPALYQINAFPVTFLIDSDGIIRYKKRGSFAEGGIDLKALVGQWLAQTFAS